MPRVVHLTTVHNPFDNRIFYRACKTLAATGYDVVLVAPGGSDGPVDDVEFIALPHCDKRLAADLRGPRLHFEGIGSYVPHQRIVRYYLRERWTAGLALFPPSPPTRRKELTKIFEYMAYGIPVLCADFPNLRQIVEGAECGLCVDPQDRAAGAAAVRYLWEHPAAAQRMGENGREAARTTYNWETQAEKLLNLYAEILP